MSWIRWKLCEKFGWNIDDKRFLSMSEHQWAWCAEMLATEEDRDFQFARGMIEYLASFYNSKLVQEVVNARKEENIHKHGSQEGFEKMSTNLDYKKNEWIQRLQKIRSNANYSTRK